MKHQLLGSLCYHPKSGDNDNGSWPINVGALDRIGSADCVPQLPTVTEDKKSPYIFVPTQWRGSLVEVSSPALYHPPTVVRLSSALALATPFP